MKSRILVGFMRVEKLRHSFQLQRDKKICIPPHAPPCPETGLFRLVGNA